MKSTPKLEMLWEDSDPQERLKKLGFPNAEAAASWIEEIVGSGWGIRVTDCERITFSAGNSLAWVSTDRGPMVAKTSSYAGRHSHLERVSRLTAWLGQRDFPVPAPTPLSNGGLRLRLGDTSTELQPAVEGSLLEADSSWQVHMAGATLARLHDLLLECPGAGEFADPEEEPRAPVPLCARIETWLSAKTAKLPGGLTESLTRFVELVGLEDPPVQLVHLDYRSANLLCRGEGISAVLDFEEAGLDHRVVDIAKAAVLLGTQFRDWRPVSAQAQATFVEGYQSVRPLSAAESEWLEPLKLWWTLQMVADVHWHPQEWLSSARSQAAGLGRTQ